MNERWPFSSSDSHVATFDSLGVPLDRLSELMFRTAEKAGFGVFVTRASATEIRNLWVNEAASRMLGWTRSELLQQSALSIVAPEDRPRIAGLQQREPGATSFTRLNCIRSDGTRVPIETVWVGLSHENARFVVSFMIDVSSHVALEEARLAEQARFRLLVEHAPDGLVIARAGSIVFANRAAAKLLGVDPPEALVGRNFADFLSPEDLQRMRERVRRAAATGAPLGPAEYRARRPDGAIVVAEITSFVTDFEGAPAVIGFARDITERANMRMELARAERLASIGTLAAGVAHEINNPLTFMTLGTGLLGGSIQASSASASEKQAMLANLAEIERGAERIAAIVRELSAFSRVDAPTVVALDVAHAIRTASRLVEHRLRRSANLKISLPEPLMTKGDPGQVEQVFVNLFINAAQSLEDSGKVGVITVRAAVEGGFIVVDVTDDGPGIPKGLEQRVFDPFFTTKPIGAGTGLGLSVCHRIVAQLGGQIRVESNPGKTTFQVTFPAHVAVEESRPPNSRERRREGRRVLVIDDEIDVARTVALVLEEENHWVQVAHSGAAALELLMSDMALDVVLCDVAMPGMSGIDVYERFIAATADSRRGARQPQFVFVTGGATNERARTFLAEWKGAILLKPFSGSELEAAIGLR